MTNLEIIDRAKQSLAAQGILSFTGRMMEGVDGEGNTVLIPEVEDIHTFAGWKTLGYKVKKGEHATARFSIWKASSSKAQKEDSEEEEPRKAGRTKMFLKEAYWFTRKQVELMEGAKA